MARLSTGSWNRVAMADLVPVSRPYLWGEEKASVCAALDEGWISSRGRFLDEFERQFARKVGVKHAVAVSSGTAAIHLALSVLDLSKYDEVIVPDFAMISPILAVLLCGATPVPVDADATWNLDPEQIEGALTGRTRGIVVIHTYGQPARMDRILEIARRHRLFVVEDAAEALGAKVLGRPVGSYGDIASFSFYANKVLTTGEGGMVVTSDDRLSERLRAKRNLCFGTDEETRYVHEEIGFNYRLTNVQAAMGLAQLSHLEDAVAAKVAIARQYIEMLEGVAGITLPPDCDWGPNVFWVFGILIEKEFGPDRAKVQRELRRQGIESRRFFHPAHRQPIMPADGVRSHYPRSIALCEKGLYLPSFVGMEPNTIRRVADCLRRLSDRGG